MDYLDELKKSIANFEKETDKLSKINTLTAEVNVLVEEVKKEAATLTESAARIAELKKQLSADCKILSEYTNREESARRKLLENVHSLVVQDTTQAVRNLSEPLTKIKSDLSNTSQDLAALVAEEKIFQRDFTDKLTKVVDKNVSDNAETRKKIALDLSAYRSEFVKTQETFQSNLLSQIEKLLSVQTAQVTYKISDAKAELSRHSENLEKRFEKIEHSIADISANINEISNDIVVLKNKRGILF